MADPDDNVYRVPNITPNPSAEKRNGNPSSAPTTQTGQGGSDPGAWIDVLPQTPEQLDAWNAKSEDEHAQLKAQYCAPIQQYRAAIPEHQKTGNSIGGRENVSYRNWLAPTAAADLPKTEDDDTTYVRRVLWRAILSKEGSPAAVQTSDGNIVTWGVGFAAVGALQNIMSNLFADANPYSVLVKDAFLKAGIAIRNKEILVASVEADVPRVLGGKEAKLAIQKDARLTNLFSDIAEGGMPEWQQGEEAEVKERVAGVRKRVYDMQFKWYSQVGAGRVPPAIAQQVRAWNDDKLIAFAGHFIHWLSAIDWQTFAGVSADGQEVLKAAVRKVATIKAPSIAQQRDGAYVWHNDQYNIVFKLQNNSLGGMGANLLQGSPIPLPATLNDSQFCDHYFLKVSGKPVYYVVPALAAAPAPPTPTTEPPKDTGDIQESIEQRAWRLTQEIFDKKYPKLEGRVDVRKVTYDQDRPQYDEIRSIYEKVLTDLRKGG